MYNDYKTANDRLRKQPQTPRELTKSQLRVLAVIAFLFLLGAMYTDHLALMAGL